MVLSGPIQSWPSRRLSGVKRICPEASGWAGDDPNGTSPASDSVFCVVRLRISFRRNGQLKPRHCREDRMSLRQVLFSTIGAIGIATITVVALAPAGAQQ